MMKKLYSIIATLLFCANTFAAVDFDGTSDVIQFGTEDDIIGNNEAHTIAVWTYPQGAGNGDEGFVVSKGNGSGRSRFQVAGSGTTNGLYWVVEGTTYLVRADTSAAYSNDAWQSWTSSWDGSGTAANDAIRINDVEITYDNTTDGSLDFSSDGFPICVGGRGDGATNTFNGVIDEVTLYNTQKSAAIITALATSKLRKIGLNFNPTRYFPLDECAEGVTCTASGMFKDVTQTGANGTGAGTMVGSKNALNYPPAIM